MVVGPGDETVELGTGPSCPPSPPVTAGIVEPGIGGKLSSNEAPNDDDGLKVFKPVNVPKPVVCDVGPLAGWAEIDGTVEVVAPVCWVETEVNNVSIEKLLFVVDVI